MLQKSRDDSTARNLGRRARISEDDRFKLVTQLLESFPNDSFEASPDDSDLLDELDRRFANSEIHVPVSKFGGSE